METKTPSPELIAVTRMNQRKAEALSKKNLLDAIANLPSEDIDSNSIDFEATKKSVMISIKIDRGTAVETLTWELSAKKH